MLKKLILIAVALVFLAGCSAQGGAVGENTATPQTETPTPGKQVIEEGDYDYEEVTGDYGLKSRRLKTRSISAKLKRSTKC